VTMFSKHNRILESTLYIVLWLIVIFFPVVLENSRDVFNWQRVLNDWSRIFPLLLIFCIHNFLLFKLFARKAYLSYFLFTIFFILFLCFLSVYILDITPLGKFFHNPDGGPPPGPMVGPPIKPNIFLRMINISMFGFITVAINLGVKSSFRFIEQQMAHEKVKKENLENELNYLRHQISPHFFMNTLNNIHALVDQDKEMAKSTIIRLSKLMRVVLYDSMDQKYPLKKEIQFLQDYMDLMKVRVSERVKIHCEFPDQLPDVSVPPLLFINFVENAFKHGVKAIDESFIHIRISVKDEKILFFIKNSIAESGSKDDGEKVGLQNVRKRLDLLFEEKYNLQISQDEHIFSVELQIPVS